MTRPRLRPSPLCCVAFALGLVAPACAKDATQETETPEDGAQPAVPDGLDQRDLSQMKTLVVDGTFCDRTGKRADQLDTNHDNRADLVTLYDADGKITCKQADLNFDGVLDAFFHYAGGELKREQYDQDHDGRIDAGRYLKDGQVYLLEQDLNRDGYVDTWRRYDRGRLVRLENDRDSDGRADLFVHYVGGKIDRVGYDIDGNGKVDQWDHDAARRAAAALDTLSAAADPIPDKEEGFVEEPAPSGPASGAVEGTGEDEDVNAVQERKDGKSKDDKSKDGKSKDDKSKDDKSKDDKSKDDKPEDAKPSKVTKPGAQKPTAQQPSAQKPGAQTPSAQKPSTQKPGG